MKRKKFANMLAQKKGSNKLYEVVYHRQNENKKAVQAKNKLYKVSTAQKNEKTATQKQGTETYNKHVCAKRGSGVPVKYFIIAKTKIKRP